MQPYNIVLGCDQYYYNTWAISCIKSIQHHVPWISIHVHIVNPIDIQELPNVSYTYKTIDFKNDGSKVGYLQAARFLAVAENFTNDQLVMTLDCDSICMRSFSVPEFVNVCSVVSVLEHPKDSRWLAGLVTFGTSEFRKEFAERLNSLDFNKWQFGRDQDILAELSSKYNYSPAGNNWMTIGKNKHNSIFLTLKGEQKITDKYLEIYNKYKV